MIRAIAIALIRHAGAIFVFEGHDRVKGETFYRPLGGAIDFGERGVEAVARELQEELGAALTDLSFLGIVENMFVFEGKPGHEIVLVYEAAFAEPHYYTMAETTGHEDNGLPFRALWKPLADFGTEGDRLYPDGLLDLIRPAQDIPRRMDR